jgi:hypothetical protein
MSVAVFARINSVVIPGVLFARVGIADTEHHADHHLQRDAGSKFPDGDRVPGSERLKLIEARRRKYLSGSTPAGCRGQ